MVQSLINAYRLLDDVRILNVTPASSKELCKFHSILYVNFLRRISHDYSSVNETDKELVENLFTEECESFGIGTMVFTSNNSNSTCDTFTSMIVFLGYDCPIVEYLASLVALVAGSSISGAKELCQRTSDVVINWYGGWHHAQR